MSKRSALTMVATAAVVAALVSCSDDSGDSGTASSSASVAPASGESFDLQAHRGGRGEYTEESLEAFDKALSLGVSTLELDIVLTKDKQPLIWHDPKIDATKCSDTAPAQPGDPQFPYVGKLVHELTLAQVRTLDCGKVLEGYPDAQPVVGNKIAVLPELFGLIDERGADAVRFNIETKVEGENRTESATPEEFVDVILSAVTAADKVERVSIQSFDWRTLPLVHQAQRSIPLVALWDETTWKQDSPWLGPVDYDAAGGDVIAGVQTIDGVSVLSPGYVDPYPDGQVPPAGYTLVANQDFVTRAHDAGFTVIPWTVNDAAVMNAQIDAGADGIITDYPTRLREVMSERGMAVPPPVR
ncbi:glycerophosphodiester phosphodiesterase family protein [Gordonia rubripertincta]|uniref:Glycerophosphodiester phosphodiesterase family protein n=2 Tax=Gordonia rubripertincta TaxID=36822 RepID=A0ABT4MNH9_GORRU|nr:glycerophosphodiester phosphodiesterase family protein [Gordonia rubripertincta]MCZ4548556.1 glycerophosphodiester phosphodiesterase family protein [Gordonia rubripertincta]